MPKYTKVPKKNRKKYRRYSRLKKEAGVTLPLLDMPAHNFGVVLYELVVPPQVAIHVCCVNELNEANFLSVTIYLDTAIALTVHSVLQLNDLAIRQFDFVKFFLCHIICAED
jgi:hypothetical protein